MSTKWNSYTVKSNIDGKVLGKELPIRNALIVYVDALHRMDDPSIVNDSTQVELTDEDVIKVMKVLLTSGHYNSLGA